MGIISIETLTTIVNAATTTSDSSDDTCTSAHDIAVGSVIALGIADANDCPAPIQQCVHDSAHCTAVGSTMHIALGIADANNCPAPIQQCVQCIAPEVDGYIALGPVIASDIADLGNCGAIGEAADGIAADDTVDGLADLGNCGAIGEVADGNVHACVDDCACGFIALCTCE